MTGLENLKAGDKVALVSRGGFRSRASIVEGIIERDTKTQVTAFGGRKFFRHSGLEVGVKRSRFHAPPRLQELTSELLAEQKNEMVIAEAEEKCAAWAYLLRIARREDAMRLAQMLPDLPRDQEPDA